jgi:hypothetical protein
VIGFLVQAIVVLFSLLAGWFWMVSATGYPISSRFGRAERVEPPDLAPFQSPRNASAAFCAAVAAIAQAAVFLLAHPR